MNMECILPEMKTNGISPVKSTERFVILDALRGFALLGIVMANFPEFFTIHLHVGRRCGSTAIFCC